ncbi:MAG: hypothetical protein ABIB97_05420 [Patescibacteria group bacterium]
MDKTTARRENIISILNHVVFFGAFVGLLIAETNLMVTTGLPTTPGSSFLAFGFNIPLIMLGFGVSVLSAILASMFLEKYLRARWQLDAPLGSRPALALIKRALSEFRQVLNESSDEL